MAMAATGAAAAQIIPNGRVWFIPRKVQLYDTIGQYADYVNFSDLFPSGAFIHPFMVPDIMKDDFAMAVFEKGLGAKV